MLFKFKMYSYIYGYQKPSFTKLPTLNNADLSVLNPFKLLNPVKPTWLSSVVHHIHDH